jgi:hypothetical protein
MWSMASAGAVAASAPRPPIAMKQPLTSGQRSRGTHMVMALSDAISPPAMPKPMTARAMKRVARVSAWEKSRMPTIPVASKAACTRRGPQRSSATPSGTCSSAKDRK